MPLVLTGCAAEPLILPDFDLAERDPAKISQASAYPQLCELDATGSWSAQCWQQFLVFEEVAENNLKLANINASIANESEMAYDHILNAAKRQQGGPRPNDGGRRQVNCPYHSTDNPATTPIDQKRYAVTVEFS